MVVVVYTMFQVCAVYFGILTQWFRFLSVLADHIQALDSGLCVRSHWFCHSML